MPTDFNLSATIKGVGLTARSGRVWPFNQIVAFPPSGASPMPANLPAEVPLASATFVIFEMWPQTNQRGTSLGRGSIDTGAVPVTTYYNAATIDALLLAAYGDDIGT